MAERRYFSAESMKQLTAPTLPTTTQEIFAAIAGVTGHFCTLDNPETWHPVQRLPSTDSLSLLFLHDHALADCSQGGRRC